MSPASAKIVAARVSLSTAISLAVLKLAAGVLTGSLAVLSSAVDSLLDILMSGVNLMAIRQAEQPADDRHPYGHGKFETVATIFQAVVIAVSGGGICFEAVRRLQTGSQVASPVGGIVVMVISLAASILVTRYLRTVAKRTDSSALAADSLHFAMDVYTNLALLGGLLAMVWLDLPWLDPVMSLLVAGYIIVAAVRLLRHGMRDLLDEQLPDEIRGEIEKLLGSQQGELFDYHNLRTRRAGSQKLIDFHMTVCKHLSVEEAHRMTDYLEGKIAERFTGSDVTIHIEPCQEANCPGRDNCPALKVWPRERQRGD
ncbi:MAG: cation transporter [Deltaproteobacteria bacterium]|nr:MAG: cation transporter [Deltaproteobacteria bacterium]